MKKEIGIFKVTEEKVMGAAKEMLAMKEAYKRPATNIKEFSSLAFKLSLKMEIVAMMLHAAVREGKAEKVDGHKMQYDHDFEYFLDAPIPHVFVRVRCYD